MLMHSCIKYVSWAGLWAVSEDVMRCIQCTNESNMRGEVVVECIEVEAKKLHEVMNANVFT